MDMVNDYRKFGLCKYITPLVQHRQSGLHVRSVPVTT